MKMIKYSLCLMMISASPGLLAQSKGEMPFTSSSPNANKLLRSAWVALADFEMDNANKITHDVLNEDPDCGMAYASLFPSNNEERDENLRKAESMKLSADERMFVEGVKARREKKSTQDYFEPLIKKYPSDYYLHLWIMLNNSDPERAIQIGETIIRKKSKFAPAYNVLGYSYMNKNDMARAEANFNKYISLRPDLANPYDSKGDYLTTAGKLEEAITSYEKAASLGMTDSKNKAESARARVKFPEPSEADASRIKEIIHASFEASKTSNVDELLKNFTEQSIEIFETQRVNVGLPNLRVRNAAMFQNGTFPKIDCMLEPVKGTGPIAVAYGKNEFIWKENASGKETERKNNVIFVLRKHNDGNWKILADHFYGTDVDAPALSADDKASISQVLNIWETSVKAGEPVAEKHFKPLSSVYSSQAIEIFPNQISNIGLSNIQARWENFLGAKFETNSLGTLGIEGLGRRAVAWGIGSQSFYAKDSEELIKSQFPWAIILTKEKDDAWKILAFHWGS
ncbi:MAG: hypothetical protein WD824_27290 [Cyclobacteriaceae bacterium]